MFGDLGGELARSGSSSKLAAYLRLRKNSRKDYCQCPACHYAKDVAAAEKVETNFCQFCPLFDGTKYACEKKGSPYEKWLNHCGNSSDSRKAAAGEMVVLIQKRLKEEEETKMKRDGWIDWNGEDVWNGIDADVRVDVKFRNGDIVNGRIPLSLRWLHSPSRISAWDIVAYRIVQANDSWIEWNGGKTPPFSDGDMLVDIKLRSGEVSEARTVKTLYWDHSKLKYRSSEIVAYRVHQPSATEITKLVEDSKDEYIKLLEIRLKQSELELSQAKGSINSYQSKLRSLEKHYLEMKKQVADLARKI